MLASFSARFLEKNDLHALSGFLMFAHAAQGYGYVTTIPAFYGLWWISPETCQVVGESMMCKLGAGL